MSIIKPISFQQTNQVYHGNGTTVQDLPVCVAKNELNPEMPPNGNYLIVKWKLTPEDIQRINESNGELWMVTLGRGVMPVRLLSDNPFSAHGFEPIDLEEERRQQETNNDDDILEEEE